jgi:hypothetical protein
MRPTRLAVALAVLAWLAPAAALAGNGPPPGINGQFFYVDSRAISSDASEAFDKVVSFANIDQGLNAFCLAGRIVYIDTTTTFNRRVQLEYSSLGTIAKATESKVVGLFTSVDLTLTIRSGPSSVHPILFGPSTITSACSLDGNVFRFAERDRVMLSCDVGPNFSAFGLPDPDPNMPSLTSSIAFAFAKRRALKVNVPKGSIKLTHVGIVPSVDPPTGFDPLVCDTSIPE